MTSASSRKKDIILSVKGLVNSFGKQVVHDNLNLDVRRGEILGIVGESGSGKSVLLRSMAGLHRPNRGEIFINDKSIDNITSFESATLMGILFQEGALFSSLNVAQNIMLPLKEYTLLHEDEQSELVQLKLALVGLEAETANKFPSELSGGMIKRVAMARALAMDPLILFLDEPTAGLDPINASVFDKLIKNLSQSLKITVAMVTHDLNTLFDICDRVAVLVDNKVIIDTLPNLLKLDNNWIKEFFHGHRGKGASLAVKHNKKGIYGKR